MAVEAIEDVRADLSDLFQLAVPFRGQTDDMVVGRIAHRRHHPTIKRPRRNGLGSTPRDIVHRPMQGAVAGEAELAPASGGALIDDAADGLGEGAMANPVEHDLSHSRLARRRFAPRFIIDGFSETLQIPALIQRAAQTEGTGRFNRRRGQLQPGATGALRRFRAAAAPLFKLSGPGLQLAVATIQVRIGVGIEPARNRKRTWSVLGRIDQSGL